MGPLGQAMPTMDIGPLWVYWDRLEAHYGHCGVMCPLEQALPTMDSMGPLGHARPIIDTIGPWGQAMPTMDTMGPLDTLGQLWVYWDLG